MVIVALDNWIQSGAAVLVTVCAAWMVIALRRSEGRASTLHRPAA